MRIAKWSTIFMIAIILVYLCRPSPVQNLTQAQSHLANLRFREMKADSNGRIIYLDVSEQRQVTDETLRAVSYLPHLKEFYAIWCPIKGEGLVHFTRLYQLETLDLHATHIGDEATNHIVHLKTLKYLNLTATSQPSPGTSDYSSMTDKSLGNLSTLPDLETLLISGKFTDQGIMQLTALKRLRRLELNSHSVTKAGIQRLLNEMPHVEFE